MLRDVRTLDRKIADLNGRIEAEVEASGTTLTEIFGVGPILAARIIGTLGDVGRFSTTRRRASLLLTPARPLWRPRERRCGAPQALAGWEPQAQLRPAHGRYVPGQVEHSRRYPYYRKKLAEGKSRKEALRCLKRRISDAVFRCLVADSQTPSRSAA